MIHIHDVVVGDVVLFGPGVVIPCDGALVTIDGAMNLVRRASRMRSRSFVSRMYRTHGETTREVRRVLSMTSTTRAVRGGT